jgi:glucose/arabinose dehydrogenase
VKRVSFLVAVVWGVAACGGDALPDTSVTSVPAVGPGTTSSTAPASTTPSAAASAGTQSPPTTAPSPTAPFAGLGLETITGGLDLPVFATSPPGDDRLFVVEKPGRIRIVRDGGLAPEPFVDLTAQVRADGLEQGLLGLAFHPGFAANGRVFVFYTDRGGATTIAELHASGDRADPGTLQVLLSDPQPAANHNGGMLEFGTDGYLYVALGDGGGANDQFGNGQRPDTRLGALLRIDVDGGEPYAVPPDNPFVEGGGSPEVWAFGLRNPWRIAIDPVDGLLYIGDVGQDRWEEIIVVPANLGGLNHGWPVMEGFDCFRSDECDPTGLVFPELAYGHGEGCSVIGGFVYRGSEIPELDGHYFYGDWCGRWVRSFRRTDAGITDERDWSEDLGDVGQILSFGRDGVGELYILTQEGLIHRIVADR